jgi:hypothetical protein
LLLFNLPTSKRKDMIYIPFFNFHYIANSKTEARFRNTFRSENEFHRWTCFESLCSRRSRFIPAEFCTSISVLKKNARNWRVVIETSRSAGTWKNGGLSVMKWCEVKWSELKISGEMCVWSLIYSYVAVCMFCAVRCVIIVCCYLILCNYATCVFLYSIYVLFFVL